MVTIRPATSADHGPIRQVLEQAFPTHDEADLVKRLRDDGDLLLELVALDGADVVGAIQFSRLTLRTSDGARTAAALAPVAVAPDRHGRGVGAALITEGVSRLRESPVAAIVVLGHPDYYPRFGFSAEAAAPMIDPFNAGLAFMAMALQPDAIEAGALPIYARAFGIDPP